MNKRLIPQLLILLLLISTTACESDPEGAAGFVLGDGALVANQGAFGTSSASVSQYKEGSGAVVNSVYQSQNDAQLGDILQSITETSGELYLVVNNSAKIEVVSKTNFKSIGTIAGLGSPRQLLPITNNKAYVSNIFSTEVNVVDLNSYSISGSIDVSGWSEAMYAQDDAVYITQNNGDQLIIVDPQTDSVTDSIGLSYGLTDIVEDMNGDLWVSCAGQQDFNTFEWIHDPAIHRVNTSTGEVTTFAMPEPYGYGISLEISPDGDQIYVLNNNVYTMFISENGLDADPLIETGISYYGLNVDPVSGDIYLCDAGDYVSEGTLEHYASDGSLVRAVQVGIAPGAVHFLE